MLELSKAFLHTRERAPRWWNWYTHTVEGRGLLGMRVRLPPWAQRSERRKTSINTGSNSALSKDPNLKVRVFFVYIGRVDTLIHREKISPEPQG